MQPARAIGTGGEVSIAAEAPLAWTVLGGSSMIRTSLRSGPVWRITARAATSLGFAAGRASWWMKQTRLPALAPALGTRQSSAQDLKVWVGKAGGVPAVWDQAGPPGARAASRSERKAVVALATQRVTIAPRPMRLSSPSSATHPQRRRSRRGGRRAWRRPGD